ncbi:putative AC transposase [Beauveria bassiana]|nr:putative AC transposase [Beauveria bassiana]KAH8713420.1 putative AC transposase [Beauveria bassiana]
MVQEVWETQYRRLRAEPSLVTGNSAAKRQRKYYNPSQVYCERTRSVSGSVAVKDELADADRFDGEDDEDELELWQSSWEDGDGDVRDPLSYWRERRRRWPRLSRMALNFLTIQAMSAECERLFSAAGRMVTPLRSRLDADMIGMRQVLRSWLRAGVIDDLDVLLVPVDQCDEVEGESTDEEEDA